MKKAEVLVVEAYETGDGNLVMARVYGKRDGAYAEIFHPDRGEAGRGLETMTRCFLGRFDGERREATREHYEQETRRRGTVRIAHIGRKGCIIRPSEMRAAGRRWFGFEDWPERTG